MFHASVQLHRANDSHTCGQVKQLIGQRPTQARDLALDPSFFRALAGKLQGIAHFQVLPKTGRSHNELTRFRYDAILRVGDPVEPRRDLSWTDWQRQRLTIGDVRSRLMDLRPETWAIRNIPTARLEGDAAAMAWLREAGPAETIGQLRAYVSQQPVYGVEPADLLDVLGEAPGYNVEMSCLESGSQGLFDAVFTRQDQPPQPAWFGLGESRLRAWTDYANDPQRDKLNRELIPRLRRFLGDKLPAFMMPSAFVVLDRLPLSPTGKIDRGALAQLPVTLRYPAEERNAPHDPLERELTQMWAEVLNLDTVGIDDDFFALGGNSLKAMQLIHRLQQRFHCAVRPGAFMQAPAVTQFAAYLRATTAAQEQGEI
jgi:acyl carrier protein